MSSQFTRRAANVTTARTRISNTRRAARDTLGCRVLRIAASVVLAAALAQPASSRPPILGVAHVRVMTSDLAKARRFYGDLLGLPEVPQAAPNVAIFRVNDRQRVIVRSGLPADRDDRFVDVAFETSDLDAAKRHLTSKSVDARDADDA